MAAALAGDDLARSMSSRTISLRSSSKRSWASASFREAWTGQGDLFQRSGRELHDDEEELKWAAIERLPTYDRLRTGMLRQALSNGRVCFQEIDVTNLEMKERRSLLESVLKVVEEDNEQFLSRLRDRTDRLLIAFSCLFMCVSEFYSYFEC